MFRLLTLLGSLLATGALAQTLEPVTTDLVRPVFASPAPGVPGRLYVAQLDGQIHMLENGELSETLFLDLSGRVTALEGEQGFYSFAFHPDFAVNGRFFVAYTEVGTGDVVVMEHHAPTPEAADPVPVRELLRVPVDEPFHHGGQLAFGPDGYLYASFGDGIFSIDLLHDAQVSQDLGDLRGKLVRLDVDSSIPYAIPPDNPFVDQAGARPEIYAYGFRNPWKFSFDRATGELYVADVGNDRWEEVNRVSAGGNYGWPAMEGRECFQYYDDFTFVDPDCPTSERYELPLVAYRHLDRDPEGGNAVTGGFVYRGERHPDWQGRYFFADFVSGRIWTVDASAEGKVEPELWLETPYAISAFVEDEAGELYILTITGGLYYLAD